MNIDLLITPRGEIGLLSNQNLVTKAIGAIYDRDANSLSLEFETQDPIDLNIPVENEFYGYIDQSPLIQFGSVIEGNIAQAYQVPLAVLGDVERTRAFQHVQPNDRPLQTFYYFIKNCSFGQPVHREDAGNEETSGPVSGEANLSSLEFAPHLARRHSMEMNPAAAPQMNVPGLGLGGSPGGGGTYYSPPSKTSDQEDD